MKNKIPLWLFVLFFIVNSSSQLSTEVARDLAKNVFKLTEKDTVEVLWILKDSDEAMLVKYKNHVRSASEGWNRTPRFFVWEKEGSARGMA